MAVAITLWEAYLIETPLAKGMSASTLLGYLQKNDSQSIHSFDDTFDYADLISAYKKNPTKIEEAIQSGYTIKFVSIYGIKRLLHLKFGLGEGKDYEMKKDKLIGIPLNEEQLGIFKELLSPNWHVSSKEMGRDSYLVDVLHITTVN